MEEAESAKEYWGSTDKQGKEYSNEKPPMYASVLARVVTTLEPGSVLEFGSNTGRNLQLIRNKVSSKTKLKGIDINQDSIDWGREEWGLDLECVDESYLSTCEANSYDLVFTVSVLDHIPDIENVVRDIYKVTSGHFILLEPHLDSEINYLKCFKDENRIPAEIKAQAPYSYLHDYKSIFQRVGFEEVVDLPLPTYFGGFGLLYRLTLFEKKDAESNFDEDFYARIHDQIILEMMLRVLHVPKEFK
jgi:SAM-dependent methyltransferase